MACEDPRYLAPGSNFTVGDGAVVEAGKQAGEESIQSRHDGRERGRQRRRTQETQTTAHRQAVPARKKQNKATQGSPVIVPEFVTLRGREKPLFTRLARG